MKPILPDTLVVNIGAVTDITHADAQFNQIQLRGLLDHEGDPMDRTRSGGRP